MQVLQRYQEAPVFVQPPVKATHRRIVRRRRVRQGGLIFGRVAPLARPYVVAAGEVLILRDGQPVDLVTAGELLDPRFWGEVTAVAHTDCTLVPRPVAA